MRLQISPCVEKRTFSIYRLSKKLVIKLAHHLSSNGPALLLLCKVLAYEEGIKEGISTPCDDCTTLKDNCHSVVLHAHNRVVVRQNRTTKCYFTNPS